MPDQAEREKAYILHAVWFNRPNGPHRYREFLEAASAIASRYGARRVEAYIPVEPLMGDFRPDYLYFTEWPDIEQFNAYMRDPAYRAVAHLREEACKKRVLLHCRRPSDWHTDGGTPQPEE